jgi:lactaldehyde reductase
MTAAEYRKAAVDAVKQLAADVGIPAKNDRVREEDLDRLAADAYADACRPGNPRDTNVEELKALYRKIM